MTELKFPNGYVGTIHLYSKDGRGQIRRWSIRQDAVNEIHIEYGVDGMQMQTETEIVDYGLAGRSRQEQIELRINSRVNKKMDSGYVRDPDQAANSKRVNSLGLDRPMLATRHDKIKNMKFEENYVQNKYDGHRCLIKNDGGDVVAYSRNGKQITSIDHILDEIGPQIPEGVTLDGELYCHGVPLQTIGSWVKKKQGETASLKFYFYDIMEDSCYSKRHSKLIDIGDSFVHSKMAPTRLLIGEFNTAPLLKSARDKGYEGLIIRPAGSPYEPGKRSKGLIKVKAWLDAEYPVIGITASVDGHAILHCKHNGKIFKATAPGTHEEKIYVMQNIEEFINKKVNIQYANLTKDGIPFHPIATMWRDPEDE